MRSVHLCDLNLAARTLMMVRAEGRSLRIAQILDQAHAADKFRKRTGRAHSRYGNGTLAAACHHQPKHMMPAQCDENYLASMEVVIRGLLARRTNTNL
jgi:hypothetical protein